MRGTPNSFVTCIECGNDRGFPLAQICRECQRKHNPRRKWPFTAQQDQMLRDAYANAHTLVTAHRGVNAKVSEALDRIAARYRKIEAGKVVPYPRYILRLRAQRLGLTDDRRRFWTPAEDATLRAAAGVTSVKALTKVLGRSHSSIEWRMECLRLSRRIVDGYSLQDLAVAFGVSHHTAQRWLAARLFPRQANGRIPDRAVRAFIFTHVAEYDLRRVDQVWFKGMIARKPIGAGLVATTKKQAGSALSDEAAIGGRLSAVGLKAGGQRLPANDYTRSVPCA